MNRVPLIWHDEALRTLYEHNALRPAPPALRATLGIPQGQDTGLTQAHLLFELCQARIAGRGLL